MVDERLFAEDLDKVRHVAREAPGSVEILAFTERYAPQPRLLSRAALLQYSARQADDASADGRDLASQLLELIEEIVELHAGGGSGDAVRVRRETFARLRDYLRQRAPANAVVFQGTGLAKRYPHFALSDIDLELRLGEITGVVGENAQGKTTLLRIVAGDLSPDAGEVGYPALHQVGPAIDWFRVKQQTAYVPQQLLAWDSSLRDMLHFEAAVHGIKGDENRAAVDFIIERMGLRRQLHKPWRHLSGGFRLRFALARALVWKPLLLVLDEPLANLDLVAKAALMQDLRELAGSYTHPIAVILSSHDIQNVESVCSQVLFLKNGRPEYAGDTHSVDRQYDTNEYELSCDLGLDELRQRLDGSPITDVRESHLQTILATPRAVGASEVLHVLLDRQVEIRAFRDISRSVRRIFDRT